MAAERAAASNVDSRLRVDPAALGSAAVAGIITLVLAPGRYGWLSAGVGTALLFLLLGWYRPGRPQAMLDWIGRALAFGSVAGLLAAMVVAWPLQDLVVGTPERCLGLAPGQEDICAGNAAGPMVGWSWLLLAAVSCAVHLLTLRPPEGTTGSVRLRGLRSWKPMSTANRAEAPGLKAEIDLTEPRR